MMVIEKDNKKEPSRDLTPREYKITKLMIDGLTNKEIGVKLSISYFTVKSHIHNIYWKKNLKSKAGFFKWYYSNKGLSL